MVWSFIFLKAHSGPGNTGSLTSHIQAHKATLTVFHTQSISYIAFPTPHTALHIHTCTHMYSLTHQCTPTDLKSFTPLPRISHIHTHMHISPYTHMQHLSYTYSLFSSYTLSPTQSHSHTRSPSLKTHTICLSHSHRISLIETQDVTASFTTHAPPHPSLTHIFILPQSFSHT